MTPRTGGIMLILFPFACVSYGLNAVNKPTGDSEPTETGWADTATASSAADTGDPTTTCPLLTFCWTSVVGGEVHVEAELQAADGVVVLGWQTWPGTDDGPTVCASREVCPGTVALRGEGIADSNRDGVGDSWSCMLQPDGSFAFVGTLALDLGGTPLVPEMWPAPDSQGCEVGVHLP